MIKILIADDHQVVIDGLSILLPSILDCEIVDTANSGKEIIEQSEMHQANVIIMDVVMPGEINGIKATEIIKKNNPSIKILTLSMMNDATSINAALEAGADGYIVKNASGNELKEAIHMISNDNIYIHPTLLQFFLNGISSGNIKKKNIATKIELEVLQLIVKGFTTKEISNNIFRSEETIRTHRKNLLKKFDCKNSAELVGYAIRNYLV